MGKDANERLYTEKEVQRLIVQAVDRATLPLLDRIDQLESQIARMGKDSSNSSKPPSSDIVKPKPKKPKGQRKPGGQKGHPRKVREPFPPDEVDRSYTYELQDTTGLEPLKGSEGWRVVQQVELPRKLFYVTEHRARRYRCVQTGRIITAPLPPEVVKGGWMGPRLSTLACYLKGVCHGSYRTVHRFFSEVLGLDLSVGLLAKAIRKMTVALGDSYQELIDALPRQPVLGLDETGLRHCGDGHWVWCAHAPGPEGLTCFAIDPSRGSRVLNDILGPDYSGIIHSDFYSAYRKYLADTPGVRMQFCWAHLIRDVKFMLDLQDKVTRNFAKRLLKPIRKMFALIHRRDEMNASRYQRTLTRYKDVILRLIRRAPERHEPGKIKKRFEDHGRSYFTFMAYHDVPCVEPTNNATERQIRFVVLDRKVTQGTKGVIGNLWCERIWSTVATCRQRGKPVFALLFDTLNAHIRGKLTPSLIYA
jgi:transposase